MSQTGEHGACTELNTTELSGAHRLLIKTHVIIRVKYVHPVMSLAMQVHIITVFYHKSSTHYISTLAVFKIQLICFEVCQRQ